MFPSKRSSGRVSHRFPTLTRSAALAAAAAVMLTGSAPVVSATDINMGSFNDGQIQISLSTGRAGGAPGNAKDCVVRFTLRRANCRQNPAEPLADCKARLIADAITNQCANKLNASANGNVLTVTTAHGNDLEAFTFTLNKTGERDTTTAAVTPLKGKGETFKIKAPATGRSWDGMDAGAVLFGTSSYVSTVHTRPGELPLQIMDAIVSDLQAHGVSTSVSETGPGQYSVYLPPLLTPQDVTWCSDDSGADSEFAILPDSVSLSNGLGQGIPVFSPPGTPSISMPLDTGPVHSFRSLDVYGFNPNTQAWELQTVWTADQNAATFDLTPNPIITQLQVAFAGDASSPDGLALYPGIGQPQTPNTPFTIPDYGVGWVDGSAGEFNPLLGSGGGQAAPFVVQPGLSLIQVPQNVGSNYWPYLIAEFPLQPDPSRPWLYIGNDPNQGFAAHTNLLIAPAGIYDPLGNPVNTLPLQIQLQQHNIFRTFQATASRDADGNLSVPTIDLGTLLAQPFQLMIGVAPGMGVLSLDALTVMQYPTGSGTAHVSDPASAVSDLRLADPVPNPAVSGVRLGYTTGAPGRVQAAIFDVTGRLVRALADGSAQAGPHALAWDGRNEAMQPVPSGTYYFKVAAGGARQAQTVTIVR